jgi:hypothetical protein
MDGVCWTSAEGADFWYGVDGDANPLVGLAAKVFAVSDVVGLPRLVAALCNALHARSGGACPAGRPQMEAWIMASRLFRHREGRVTFLGAPGELTSAERELVDYFSTRSGSDYAAIKSHLLARGLSGSTISKAVTQSPVVHVDRSGGLRAYRYSLVGPLRQPSRTGPASSRIVKSGARGRAMGVVIRRPRRDRCSAAASPCFCSEHPCSAWRRHQPAAPWPPRRR